MKQAGESWIGLLRQVATDSKSPVKVIAFL